MTATRTMRLIVKITEMSSAGLKPEPMTISEMTRMDCGCDDDGSDKD